MANNTEDVELRTLDQILEQAFTDGASDTMWQDDRHVEIFATAKAELQALIQQEANRQKLELLDRLVNHKKVGTVEVFGGVFGTTKNIEAIPLSAIEQVRKEWSDELSKVTHH